MDALMNADAHQARRSDDDKARCTCASESRQCRARWDCGDLRPGPPNTGDKLRASNTLNARLLHPLVRRPRDTHSAGRNPSTRLR